MNDSEYPPARQRREYYQSGEGLTSGIAGSDNDNECYYWAEFYLI